MALSLSPAGQRAVLMVVSWVQMMEAMMAGPKAVKKAVNCEDGCVLEDG